MAFGGIIICIQTILCNNYTVTFPHVNEYVKLLYQFIKLIRWNLWFPDDSQWLVMKIGHQDINSNIGHHDSMRQVVFSS